MYFNIEPKSRIKDFFNYRTEYEEIKSALKRGEKIISLIGVRRVGKTSLLNVLYHELSGLKVWIDGRIISDPKKELFSIIYDIAKEKKSKIFGKIESVDLSVGNVGMRIIRKVDESFLKMEEVIRKAGRIHVFIDEAQRIGPLQLADVISYFYDRIPNVSFIISGSEVGVIEDVLGERDAAAHPLFGRHIVKIEMKRLDKERAREYLSMGFRQLKFRISEEEIRHVVEELDGLIGWLTLYGYERAVLKNSNALEKTKKIATKVVASELQSFLQRIRNKKLYITIIRNSNHVTWSQLYYYVSKDMRKKINPNTLTQALERLMKYSFIMRRENLYFRADPFLLDATFYIH